jgi:predicted transcriptional regulator
MKKRILLSIHPEFAEAIFTGDKRFEFRRITFKRTDIRQVVVYATSPVCRVVGYFEIDGVFADRLDVLWRRTKKFGGVSKDDFDAYFFNRTFGFAIKVKNPVRFKDPQPLTKYLPSAVPPQSFCYI